MKPALCRRDFVTRGLVLAGAALLLPAQRLSAVASSLASGATSDSAPTPNAAHRAVLAWAGRYGDLVSVDMGAATTQIAVRIRCFDAMQQTLGNARAHGIARLRADGNRIAFTLDGHRFELENLHHVA